MIHLLYPLSAGNALRILLSFPAGTTNARLLRRTDEAFTGPDDPDAYVVMGGYLDTSILDWHGLVNGQTYHYRLYVHNGTEWVVDDTRAGVPTSTFQLIQPDPMRAIPQRIEEGLDAWISRVPGIVKGSRKIPVLTAPPLKEAVDFPVVVCGLRDLSPTERALGDMVAPGYEDNDDPAAWTQNTGWIARCTMEITGWTLNPEQRIRLGNALYAIVLANLEVWNYAGVQRPEFFQRHEEDYQSYNAPVFMVVGTLTFDMTVVSVGTSGPINQTESIFDIYPPYWLYQGGAVTN